MPAFIGVNTINQISGSGSAVFGDAPFFSNKSATKTFSGGGSGNTGVISIVNQLFSFSNSIDPDVNDENVIAPGPGVFSPVVPGALPIPVGRVSPVVMRGRNNVNGVLASGRRKNSNKKRSRG